MFTFGKQDFKIFIVYKGNKEIRTLCILFLEMSIYKWFSDKTKCMYPMTKVKKKSNCELICNKNYLKSEQRFNTKETFQSFYVPVPYFWFS